MSRDATAAAAGNSLSLDIGTAGTNRAVVVFGSDEAGSSQITGVTVDGKSCTAVQQLINTDGLGNVLEGWVIFEAELGSSNGVVNVALVGADTGYGITALKMSGVLQAVQDSGGNNTAVTGPTIPVPGIDCPADGHVVAAYSQGTGSLTCSYTSPLSEDESIDPSSADLFMASGDETAAQTNKTYTGTMSASFNRGCGIVMTFAPAPVELTGNQSSISNAVGSVGVDDDNQLSGQAASIGSAVGSIGVADAAPATGVQSSIATTAGSFVEETTLANHPKYFEVDYDVSAAINGSHSDWLLWIVLTETQGAAIAADLGRTDAKDFIVTNDDGTVVYPYFVLWDDTNERGLLGVRIPAINDTTDGTLRVYLGETSGPDHSDSAGATADFEFLYVPDGTSTPTDLTGNHASLTTVGTPVDGWSNSYGPQWNFVNADGDGFDGPSIRPGIDEFSVFAFTIPDIHVTSVDMRVATQQIGTSEANHLWMVGFADLGTRAARARISLVGGAATLLGGTTLPDGNPYCLFLRYDGAGPTSDLLLDEGAGFGVIATSSTPSGDTFSDNVPIEVGQGFSQAFYDGAVVAVGGWPTAQSTAYLESWQNQILNQATFISFGALTDNPEFDDGALDGAASSISGATGAIGASDDVPTTGSQSSIASSEGSLSGTNSTGLPGEQSSINGVSGALSPSAEGSLSGAQSSIATAVGAIGVDDAIGFLGLQSSIAAAAGAVATEEESGIVGSQSSITTANGALGIEIAENLPSELSAIATDVGAFGIETALGLLGDQSSIAGAGGAFDVQLVDSLSGENSNVTAAIGSFDEGVSFNISGSFVGISAAVGVFGVDDDATLSGSASTISTDAGDLDPEQTINGVQSGISTDVGSLSAEFDSDVVGLESSLASATGSAIAWVADALSGEQSSIAAAAGDLDVEDSVGVTGEQSSIAAAAGSIGLGFDVPLAGEQDNVSAQIGQISVPGDSTLFGRQSGIGTGVGSIGPEFGVEVVGEMASLAETAGQIGPSPSTTLSGAAASLGSGSGELSKAADVSLVGVASTIAAASGTLGPANGVDTSGAESGISTDVGQFPLAAQQLEGDSDGIATAVGVFGPRLDAGLEGTESSLSASEGTLDDVLEGGLSGKQSGLATAFGSLGPGRLVPLQGIESGISASFGAFHNEIVPVAGRLANVDVDVGTLSAEFAKALVGAASSVAGIAGSPISYNQLSTHKRSKLMIKEFRLAEEDRPSIVFTSSPKVRLNPMSNRMELAYLDGGYPTDDDLEFRTRLTNPLNAKRWVLMQADSNAPNGSTIGYRLSEDGVNDLYWDGASWSAAGSGDWNSEEEFALNLGSFQPSVPAIQIVVNLKTTDPSVTPWISRVKLSYESDIQFQDDYIARSLARTLRSELEGIGTFAFATNASTPNVNLGSIEKPYAITGVDSAYNETDDPYRLQNLSDTYDVGTKVLTFSSPIPSGKTVKVLFLYKPEVAINRDQDFSELAKVPAVVIENITVIKTHKIVVGEHVVRKSDGTAFQLPKGYHADILFDLRLITASEYDQHSMASELAKFFENHDRIRSVGQDEFYRLDLLEPYSQQTKPDQAGVRSGRLRARLANAVFYERDAEVKHGTLRFRTIGGNLRLDVIPS